MTDAKSDTNSSLTESKFFEAVGGVVKLLMETRQLIFPSKLDKNGQLIYKIVGHPIIRLGLLKSILISYSNFDKANISKPEEKSKKPGIKIGSAPVNITIQAVLNVKETEPKTETVSAKLEKVLKDIVPEYVNVYFSENSSFEICTASYFYANTKTLHELLSLDDKLVSRIEFVCTDSEKNTLSETTEACHKVVVTKSSTALPILSTIVYHH